MNSRIFPRNLTLGPTERMDGGKEPQTTATLPYFSPVGAGVGLRLRGLEGMSQVAHQEAEEVCSQHINSPKVGRDMTFLRS